MNSTQAKQIPIEFFLNSSGITPNNQKGADLWYNSPLRKEDKTPSFKVNQNLNTWYDFSLAQGGTIIDLVCIMYNESVKEALQRLSDNSPTHQKNITFSVNKKPKPVQQKSSLVLKSATEITSSALVDYIHSRAVSLGVARKYLKQVNYYVKNVDSTFFALGFQNNKGDYEFRSKTMKGFIGEHKTISTINGVNNDNIAIFEGFFDFLAFLTDHNISDFQSSVLVMNSVNMKAEVLHYLMNNPHKKAYFFLDNDAVGKEAFNYLSSHVNKLTCIDKSAIYQGYNDYNEFLMAKKKRT